MYLRQTVSGYAEYQGWARVLTFLIWSSSSACWISISWLPHLSSGMAYKTSQIERLELERRRCEAKEGCPTFKKQKRIVLIWLVWTSPHHTGLPGRTPFQRWALTEGHRWWQGPTLKKKSKKSDQMVRTWDERKNRIGIWEIERVICPKLKKKKSTRSIASDCVHLAGLWLCLGMLWSNLIKFKSATEAFDNSKIALLLSGNGIVVWRSIPGWDKWIGKWGFEFASKCDHAPETFPGHLEKGVAEGATLVCSTGMLGIVGLKRGPGRRIYILCSQDFPWCTRSPVKHFLVYVSRPHRQAARLEWRHVRLRLSKRRLNTTKAELTLARSNLVHSLRYFTP
jgi:hypothetical protein